MNMRVDKDTLSPDDIASIVDGDLYEFVHGMPVEKPMGAESDWIGATLIGLLWSHCRPANLGFVFGAQTGYRCFPKDRKKLRKPDVSFIARGRLPGDKPPKGDIDIAPDLAVEVVSPNDPTAEVDVKVLDYLSAGVRLVWVIIPETKSVHVRRPDRSATILAESDTLSGEDVVPGFTCAVADLFV
jgi:Uma2 family endonuclease